MAESADARSRSSAGGPRRDRIVIWLCVSILTALAWAYLVQLTHEMASASTRDAGIAGMAMAMPASWSVSELAFLFSMWTVMMVAMMTPAATPVLLLFAGAQARRRAAHARASVALFALGYAIVWIAFSGCAALAQWALHPLAVLSPSMAPSSGRVAAAILCAAGVYQLLPIKRACLVRCRSPLAFLMTRWRDGPAGAFEMGLRHGTWCVGCCWALMGVLFVVGVMNLVAVAALALVVLIEKTGPAGVAVARIGGVLLVAAGGVLLIAR